SAYLPSEAENFNVHLSHRYYGLFAQDQWRVSPRLTVNYGARYDLESGLGSLVQGDKNNVAPPLVIAYSLGARTVVRAGFGTFYDRHNLTIFFISTPHPPPVIAGLPLSGHMD